MNKKVLISSVAITAAASAVAITLFVPHTITVKEYMDGNLKGFKPETTEIKTSLFDSLKNPITVSHRNVDHADYTGTTVDGNLLLMA